MHFRLFDLPYELVEYVSFTFFDIHEAHKLLTMSPTLHVLFSRRVWWQLDSRVFTLPDPTRSMAIVEYGKLVRYIDLDDDICSAIQPDINSNITVYDMLSVFSGVTTLRIGDNHKLLMSIGIQFKDILICFPSLYKLIVVIGTDNEPYDVFTLAHALNHQQKNSNSRPLKILTVSYFVRSNDYPWTRLSDFVQMVMGNCVIKIDIPPWSTTPTLPSQPERQILSKHLTYNPQIKKQEDTQYCYAIQNRSLFWKSLDMHSSCVYPQRHQLSIQTCCVNPTTYDYCDITPTNFPCLQSIEINGHECNNMISHSYPPAWIKVLLQKWPHLSDLELSLNTTCDQLVAVLECNYMLTTLGIWLQPEMLDENNVFNLAIILPLLPRLQRLYIDGKFEIKLDYNPGYDGSDILARSQLISTSFFRLCLSSRIYKLLYSLPKLDTLSILGCQMHSAGAPEVINMDSLIGNPYEINVANDDYVETIDEVDDDNIYEELMAALITISARFSINNSCIIKTFYLEISRDGFDWPLDFTLEMIALTPKLRTFTFTGETDDIPKAIKSRFPHIKILP